MTTTEGRPVRAGSAVKRAAILSAARELFLADGFDRTSVDAVSARAQVSKRTVYDYFGDKRALLVAVVEEAGGALLATIRSAVTEELSDVADLEAALVAFCARVTRSAFGSSDYAALMRLTATEAPQLPELADLWFASAPEEAIAERFAELGAAGLLEAPDPRLAADHFVALTFLLVSNRLGAGFVPDHPDVGPLMVAGVRAFLRAYAPR